MPLAVARESSVRLIDDAIANGKLIAVFTQRDAVGRGAGTGRPVRRRHGDPHPQDVQAARRQPAADRPGARAAHARRGRRESSRICARASARRSRTPTTPIVSRSTRSRATSRRTSSRWSRCRRCCPTICRRWPTNITEPGRLADFIASSLSTISTAVKQEVLETLDIRARMDSLNRILIKELEVLELGSKIQSQVQSEVGKNQRDYFLREQMKAIQKELGEGDDQTKEIEELAEKIEAAGMPESGQEGGAPRARSAVEDAGRGRRVHRVAHLPRLARRAPVGEADRRGHRSAAHQERARRRSLRSREGRRTASSSTWPSAS